ncbi:ATP synthase subunit A [Bacillus cereus group sp. MYBK249-1]|uniref:ATP synthase subunit A n=1 Tax=unclassified Bacillus cereus group TaxID=2750818 RepID=UPI003F798432
MNIKKVVLASALGFTALAGTNLPGLETPKASADSIELETIQGHVVAVDDTVVHIELNEYGDPSKKDFAINLGDITNTFKVGDQVKATGRGWRGFGDSTSFDATSIEKVNKGNSLTKTSAPSFELDTIQGRVVELEDNIIHIESKEYNGHMDNIVPITMHNTTNTFKIGDQVKATGTLWRNMRFFMEATSVEKINETNSLTPGLHYNSQGAPDYVIGEITKQVNDTDKSLNYAIVTYPTKSGKSDTVRVDLSSQAKFNVGDMVKVKNIVDWIRTNISLTEENNIEKINETKTSTVQNDKWIWS